MGTLKFDKENTRKYGFKFNARTDADIIRRLDEIGNKQSYIKALIRADIAAHAAPGASPQEACDAPKDNE